MDEEGEEEGEGEEAFQRSDKRRRRRWRRGGEARKMDGKKRGGSRHEKGEIVSNNCEEERMRVSVSGEEGGRDRGKGSNEGKEARTRGKESEERVNVGENVGNSGAGDSDSLFFLILQWFCCWLAGYLGIAFPWILLLLLLHNRWPLLLNYVTLELR